MMTYGKASVITFTVRQNRGRNEGRPGQNWAVTMNPQDTVRDLKRLLERPEYSGIPVGLQKLLFSGQTLRDDNSIGEYGIVNGSRVILMKISTEGVRPELLEQILKDEIRRLFHDMRQWSFKYIAPRLREQHCDVEEWKVADLCIEMGFLEHVGQFDGNRYVRDMYRGGIEGCQPSPARLNDNVDDDRAEMLSDHTELFDGHIFQDGDRRDIRDWHTTQARRSGIENTIVNMFIHYVGPNEMAFILTHRLGLTFPVHPRSYGVIRMGFDFPLQAGFLVAAVLLRDEWVELVEDASEANSWCVTLRPSSEDDSLWDEDHVFDSFPVGQSILPLMPQIRAARSEASDDGGAGGGKGGDDGGNGGGGSGGRRRRPSHDYTPGTPQNSWQREIQELFLYDGVRPDRIAERVTTARYPLSILDVINTLINLDVAMIEPRYPKGRIVRVRDIRGQTWDIALPPHARGYERVIAVPGARHTLRPLLNSPPTQTVAGGSRQGSPQAALAGELDTAYARVLELERMRTQLVEESDAHRREIRELERTREEQRRQREREESKRRHERDGGGGHE